MINIPNLEENRDNIIANIQNETGITDNKILQHGFFGGIISSLSILVSSWYKKFLNTVKVWIITKAMTGQWLDLLGNYLRLPRKSATQSTGQINIQGIVGTFIPVGSIFSAVNSGQFEVLYDATIINQIINPTSITAVGNTVTITTLSAHNLSTGNKINSTNSANTDFNVVNAIISVISENKFTYVINNSLNATSTTGTVIDLNIALLNVKSISTGTITNMISGSTMNLLTQISGADNLAYVNFYNITGGTDKESDDNYRARIEYKLFNNTQDYTETGVQTYLLQKYSEITRIKIIRNYIDTKTIKSITNWIVDNTFKVIEFHLAHGIISPSPFYQIVGSSIPQLNQYNGFVVSIIDDYKVLVYNNSTTSQDTTSTNMRYIPYQYGYNTLMFLKDNDIDIYPTTTDIQKIKQELIDNVMPWTDTEDTFAVKAPVKKEVKFHFTLISPNSTAMQSAIQGNLVDFLKLYKNIGDSTIANEYNGLLYRTIDANGNRLKNFNLVLTVNGNVGVSDIICGIDEIADLNSNNVTFA